MKTIILAALLGFAAADIQAEHSTLAPRAQQLFGHMKRAVQTPDRLEREPVGPAARSPISRDRKAAGFSDVQATMSSPAVYTGRNPLQTSRTAANRGAVASGGACEAGCAKQCCAK